MRLKTTRYSSYSSSVQTQSQVDWGWGHTFILLQFIFQFLLLFPQFGVLRVPMRVTSFALSLFLLAWLRGSGSRHPATNYAIAVLFIIGASFCLHPYINSILAGAAQWAMYVAILGPILWVTKLKLTPKGFERLIFMLWAFHTLSAAFGVLQIYFPGKFQPYLSTAIQNSQWAGENLIITLANGAQVYRPMGLTDTPGGAASAGFYALLLGIGIALHERNLIMRITCLCSGVIGLFCIYLSQVRSILVFLSICLVGLVVVLLRQGKYGKLSILIASIAILALASFSWAIAVGGESTLDRLTSLVSDRADTVYYENRGHFLEHTLNVLLPQYPLGAGLGRWGMMNSYFGDNSNPLTAPIWVEIQWTGWLLDGGIPLIIAYSAALFAACHAAWKIAISRQLGSFSFWGGLIFAYNLGAIALTFNYPLFISQGGMEFWLLNTALFVAAHQAWLERTHPSAKVRS